MDDPTTDIIGSVRAMREPQMGLDTQNITISRYEVMGVSRSYTISSIGQDVSYNLVLREKLVLTSAVGTLQMLGCIPQTPSPSPSPVPTNQANATREQELRILRVSLGTSGASASRRADNIMQSRLAELEGADTKAEGANSKTRIKREIGELEASDDLKITEIRSTKRIRNAGPVETIDLTAD